MLAANAPGLRGNDLCDYLEDMDREEVAKLNQEVGPANIQADPCVERTKGSVLGGATGVGIGGAAVAAAGAPIAFGVLMVCVGVALGYAFVQKTKEQTMLPWRDRYVSNENERYARLRGKVTMINDALDGLDEIELDIRIRHQLNLAKTYFQSTAECYKKQINVSVDPRYEPIVKLWE